MGHKKGYQIKEPLETDNTPRPFVSFTKQPSKTGWVIRMAAIVGAILFLISAAIIFNICSC